MDQQPTPSRSHFPRHSQGRNGQNATFNGAINRTSSDAHHQNRSLNNPRPGKEPLPLPDSRLNFGITVFDASHGKSYPFEVEATETVKELEQQILYQTSIPCEQQMLSFNGQELEVNETIEHYGIKKGSEIYLCGRMRGG